ncbi:kelch-like protein 5 [Episyrphus balteatus]|uniref:kelch-like protein 5 n=1 Tax=Episyrphus balteatus TaxID=286459 RepID=UPI00248665FA|nr:kelch-like protein 5 [Episyrphus balteatus]
MSTLDTSPSASQNEKTTFTDDQHASNLLRKLLKLYEKEELFDILLIAGEDRTKIQVHKIVLTALSEYFLEIFRGLPKTSNINELEIKEVESSTLKLIVDYMYSGSIDLKLESIETLLRSAVLLKMTNLVKGCCEFLENNLNIDNCLCWSHLAKELGLSDLQEKTLNFIYANFEKVTKGNEFLVLNEIELKDLLFNNNSYRDFEEQVFLSLVDWIEYEKVDRRHLLFDLLSMVRYQLLSAKFIIKNRKMVCKTAEYQILELICTWLEYHLVPESRTSDDQVATLASKPKIEDHLEKDFLKFSVIHFNEEFEPEIRSYNKTLNTWCMDKRFTPISTRRFKYSVIVIDEKLFIVGGQSNNDTEKSVEYLDFKTYKWSTLPNMRVARCESQLANLSGHLCVFGGFEKSDEVTFINSVEIFNFSTNKWTDLNPPIKPNRKNKIVGHNGILYIFDFHYGCLQCYDVSANQWTFKDLPIDETVGEFRTAAVDNFLYAIIGGELQKNLQWTSFKNLTFKRFDLSNDTWSEVGILKEDKIVGKTFTIIGSKILFVNTINRIAEYNIETKEFHLITVPPSVKYFYNAFIFQR